MDIESYLQAVRNRPLGKNVTAEWLLTQSHLSDMLGITRTHLNALLATQLPKIFEKSS